MASGRGIRSLIRALQPLLEPLQPQLALATGVWAEPGGGAVLVPGATTGRPAADVPGWSGPSAVTESWAPGAADGVADLVGRAQSGDPEAFGLLYDRYVDAVYRFVYVRVGSAELAEDLTSETFLRALRRLDTFSWQGRDIGAWFVTIARNLVTDHFKASRTRLEFSTADVRDAAPEHGTVGPEQAMIAALDSERVMAAVRELNADQQEVIELRFFQELAIADVARIMDRNEGAIKALQHRAVRSLARLLGEEDR